MSTDSELRGIVSVLATPFTGDGALDEESLERLVEHVLEQGVDGVACLGLASEAYKLDDSERRRVITRVVDSVAGRAPVVVGADHGGTAAAVHRVVEAAQLGAAAAMVYPPTFVKPDRAGVVDYYLAIARAVDIPIVVQDAPAWTGVALPVELLLGLREEAPTIRYVKVEAPPASDKIATLVSHRFDVVSGYGVLHLAEDIRAGAVAAMPGCALARLYCQLWRLTLAGDDEGLWRLHAQALPLLSFQMSSLDVFVAVQKLVLARRGVIASPRLRAPGAPLTTRQVEWLDLLLQRCDLNRYV